MIVQAEEVVKKTGSADGAGEKQGGPDGIIALQSALFDSANFSSIATDEKGVIQLFNVGADAAIPGRK